MESADRDDGKRPPDQFFLGGGEMGSRIRAFDWSRTPLGPIASWSPSLKMMVRFLLANRFPMLLWWGPQFIQIYNDAYRPVLGAKHPDLGLGRPVSECWSEIWHILRPLIETPFNGGPATWMEDIPLEINRYGFVEETHFTIAYSPVPDEAVASGIGGVLATVHEISEKVVGERRLMALRDLGTRAVEAKTAEEACAMAAETLAKHPKDIPFALLYLIDADGQRARLAGAAGVAAGGPISPAMIELDRDIAAQQAWPLEAAVRTEALQVVEDLPVRFGDAVPRGPWADPPRQAVVVPIRSNIAHQLAGLLVVGVSSRLRLDDPYRSFIELVAGQIVTAIANARAYEEEKRRAEALAEIDRAKTAFFSNVSHEFRTPLTLMLGPLEEALSRSPASRQREELEIVYRNGRRLLKLVNTLLDFSRIEAGRVQAFYEPTDLAAFTAELASVFRSAVERAGMQLIVDCAPLAAPVFVDREMWEKMVLNLLSNAFKFTFAGSITVRLRPAGDDIELQVADTGAGIAAAELPRLFERFHRIRGVQSRSHEGSGIGLALVRELARLHGGNVCVESAVGKGTTFIVRIPAGSAHLPPDRVATEHASSPMSSADIYVEEALRWLPEDGQAEDHTDEAEPLDGGTILAADFPARILLADDNADMRDYVKRILSRHWTVEAVADGQAALEAVSQRLPDLVLSDVMMPGLDGYEIVRALRRDPLTRRVPVILLSARAGEESRIEGLEAGADDYLSKPFSARELVARVGAHLKIARIRGEAEKELRASEVRFRSLFEAMDEGYCVIEVIFDEQNRAVDYRFLEINSAFEKQTGIKDAKGRLMRDIAPEHEQHWFDIYGHIALTGETLRFENTAAALGRHYDVCAFRIGPPELRHVGIVFNDITERRRAAERLRESEARLRAIFDGTYEFIGLLSPTGTLLEANRASLEFVGCRREELIGLPFWQTPWWTNTEGAPELVKQAIAEAATGEFVRREIGLHSPSGQFAIFDFSLYPIRDEAGKVVLLVPEGREITERKRLSEQVEVERARLRYLFDKAPTFVALLNGPEHIFELANPAYAQLVGHRQLIGKPVREAFTEIEGQGFFELLDEVYRTGEPFVGREMCVRLRREPNGPLEECYLDFIYQAVFEAGGRVSGIFAHGVDVTEQVLARRAVEEANSLKDEFLATLSHELRNPLNSILGYAEVLLRSPDAKQSALVRQAAGTIRGNAEAQAQLISDLLDLSRLQTGKLMIEPRPLHLAPLVGDAVETVREQAVKQGIELDVALIAEPLTVNADPVRVQQIIWNLVNNAVKFTDKGGRVSVSLGRDNGEVALVVEDSGQGIAREFLPHVFDMFRQADAGVTRRHGGLGVGLALVRQLTELHGGRVEAYSAGPGRGARFTVRLPLHRANPEECDSASAAQASGKLTGVRILVVDDTEDSLEMLRLLLTAEGATVETALSGPAGLHLANAASFDLVISDISMPEMDGYEFLKILKARPHYREIPAIALTGFGRKDDITRARQAGFTTHLTKPLDISVLIALARRLMSSSRTRR